MEKHSTDSGEASSATESTASRKPKPKTHEAISSRMTISDDSEIAADQEPGAIDPMKPDRKSLYPVSNPLPPSRISWLKRQSKHVAEVSKRRFGSQGER